ncbi:hypothetical protein yberc0001_39050 [Yersinia bercovieri ATCC 43970]|uniref:Uncharacterized protein n=1 Tax=Yersinia bercovieri ATCC 43970 TaxID=349968 RepID=A0ABM9XTQ5_YERBE|nr:hypothetical protein yberc0001_39050 [Yersinia bercovieri ATCC 43970]
MRIGTNMLIQPACHIAPVIRDHFTVQQVQHALQVSPGTVVQGKAPSVATDQIADDYFFAKLAWTVGFIMPG